MKRGRFPEIHANDINAVLPFHSMLFDLLIWSRGFYLNLNVPCRGILCSAIQRLYKKGFFSYAKLRCVHFKSNLQLFQCLFALFLDCFTMLWIMLYSAAPSPPSYSFGKYSRTSVSSRRFRAANASVYVLIPSEAKTIRKTCNSSSAAFFPIWHKNKPFCPRRIYSLHNVRLTSYW